MTQDAPEILISERIGAVHRLTLDDPKRLNALSEEMLARLQAEIDALAVDKTVKALVIRGTGKAFCAGHDLKQMQAARQAPDGGRGYYNALFAQCARFMTSVRRLPIPVIAEVHGVATAAGCQLVATCDMAVAEEGARFGVNGVNIGLFCSTPMVALSRNIAPKKAFEMLTTGAFVGAEEAERLGLVNHVVPAEALSQAALELAGRVAEKLGAAVKIGKEAFYAQGEMSLDAAYAYTGRVMAENMLLRDTEEGVNAFLEKRKPDWAEGA
ncbi:enoyl-CoA hydratase [Rhodovulum sp. DZ06]|uniref:enoyl-CoA hydratase n=1 Tax=Rhodovulum sp. DZ06 TaxID=3425126 RepID=UPI003D35153E